MHRVFILRGLAQKAALSAFLDQNSEAMAAKGCPLVVEVKEEKAKRSLAQNARYFGEILKTIEDQAWVEGRQHPAKSWHEVAKCKFIGLIDKPGGGSYGQSSTDLNVKEFKDFMDKVEAWAATELGVTFYDRGAA